MKTKLKQISNINPTFKNVFEALNRGEVIFDAKYNCYYNLSNDGSLVSHTHNPLKCVPYNSINYVLHSASGTIYEEVEVKWYDDIPKRGILCKVSDIDKNLSIYKLAIIVKYCPSQEMPFVSLHKNIANEYSNTVNNKYAEPLTLDELKEFLYEN